MITHGGNLQEAAARFGHSISSWIDLSTGINPTPYPAPILPTDAWHRLPQTSQALTDIAKAYYGAPQILPVAGTQAAIQALPRLRSHSKVIVASPTYAEHAHCWRKAGHQVIECAFEDLDAVEADCDVLVVCNPNNPTGELVETDHLVKWADQLAIRNGWMIVDEAFCDVTPELSVARFSDREGLIVLRSVGKFFGLAGLRLGFVAGATLLLNDLAECLGPWTISGPAQIVGETALADTLWQENMIQKLSHDGERLKRLLLQYGIQSSGCALFQWWHEPLAEAFWLHMAQQAIWVRHFAPPNQPSIRLGLPSNELAWTRLENALHAWRMKNS